MLSSTGLKPSASASGSQPLGNTKKDKIQRLPSSTQKNKVEAHPGTVKSSLKNKNCAVEPKVTATVPHLKLNENFELICVKCNGYMLSDNHGLCVPNVINDVNAHPKSKAVKKISKRKVWKPTGKVFTKTRFTWRPTGQTFIIVGNEFPLTRITITTIVPSRKPIALETDTPKPVVTLVYLRKPMKSKTTNPVSKSKVIKSVSANNKEPSKSWGSTASNVPSFSLDECRVYYMEGLGHNLFSVGQFGDSNLEVAFRQHTCYIRNLEGIDLLIGSQGNNLYTLSLRDMMASSPICLLSKDLKTKSWLWHRRLSHLNFDMDLCGLMHVISVNEKKYILVIVDDYSWFTWVKCLISKDEAPDFIIKFLKMIQVRLKTLVRRIITDNGTEFVNQTLREYYEKPTPPPITPPQPPLHCRHTIFITTTVPPPLPSTSPLSSPRHPPTVGTIYTMVAISTASTPLLCHWHPVPNITSSLPRPPATNKSAFGCYYHREGAFGSGFSYQGVCLEPALHELTPTTISLGLMPNPLPSTSFVPPSRNDWDLLFEPLFDELLTPPPSVDHPVPEVIALIAEVIAPEPAASTSSPFSITVDQDALSANNSQTTPETQTLVNSNDVEEDNHDLTIAHMNKDPFVGVEESPKTPNFRDDPFHENLHEDSNSQGSSSNVRQTHTPFESLGRWTKDHPIANVIGDPSRSVSAKKKLQTDAMRCFFDAFLTIVEPKNFKQAMTEASWIDTIQEEIH
uniref:Integrase catalytic domain-containing protein n=1 Tax=Tanacetum cinerariifolium TaxID=118510 RepID=A0A6L2J1P2_TANCI|nr:hypothetical protein [Tanacetum cinerariifolium]